MGILKVSLIRTMANTSEEPLTSFVASFSRQGTQASLRNSWGQIQIFGTLDLAFPSILCCLPTTVR